MAAFAHEQENAEEHGEQQRLDDSIIELMNREAKRRKRVIYAGSSNAQEIHAEIYYAERDSAGAKTGSYRKLDRKATRTHRRMRGTSAQALEVGATSKAEKMILQADRQR